MAKYLDQDGLLYFWQQLKTMFAGKVDVVSGKGLSTNDFTNADQTKLNGIEAGAEVNVIEAITVNGTAAPITGTTAAITTPTKTSDLTNDGDGTSAFATQAYVNTNGGKIDTISVNGTAQTITNKNVDITVPTATSELTNDSGFITSSDIPEGAAASTTTPLMDGTAAVGTEVAFARGDHRHPTDTSRAPLASPIFTGTPAAPTATKGTDTTQIATTEYVQNELEDYLTSSDASSTYLTQTNASSTYLTQTNASSTYLTQTSAANTYLTQANAQTTYATKSEISNVYKYKGSVASVSDLPASGNTTGDVYDVQATNMNYAWTGTAWDQLGSSFSITSITNAEIDAILAA